MSKVINFGLSHPSFVEALASPIQRNLMRKVGMNNLSFIPI